MRHYPRLTLIHVQHLTFPCLRMSNAYPHTPTVATLSPLFSLTTAPPRRDYGKPTLFLLLFFNRRGLLASRPTAVAERRVGRPRRRRYAHRPPTTAQHSHHSTPPKGTACAV